MVFTKIKKALQRSLIVWLSVGLVQLFLQFMIRAQDPVLLKQFAFNDLGYFVFSTAPALLVIVVFSVMIEFIGNFWVKHICGALMICVFTFFYYINYVNFKLSLHFISYDALRFSLANPYLQFKFFMHTQPYGAIYFLGYFALLYLIVSAAILYLSRVSQKFVVPLSFTAALLISAGLFSFLLFTGSVQKYLMKIEPLAAIIQSSARTALTLPPVEKKEFGRILRRPIMTMDDYMRGVQSEENKKKNVIIILIESLRPDQLMSFSGQESIMENLDQLALKSIRFTRTYTQSAHSNYADPAVFSSQYPLRSNRAYLYPRDHQFPRLFIYDILKAWGYKTALFSSQDEDWGHMSSYMKTSGLDVFFHAGNFNGPAFIQTEENGLTRWLQGEKLSGNIDDRITVSAAMDWLDSIGKNPFFLYLNFQNSHMPYVIPQDFKRRKSVSGSRYNKNVFRPEPLLVGNDLARYSDSLSYVDQQLGKVIQYLQERHLLQDTLIVVAGDNGESFFEHNSFGHIGPLYEEAVHVPTILFAPDLKPRADNRPAMLIDIVPTLLHQLGLPEHPSFQGVNLLSAQRNDGRVRFLVSQSAFLHQFAVVKDAYKLIWTPHLRSLELYNLNLDSKEKNDLVSTEQQTALEMAGYLKMWAETQLNYYQNPSQYLNYYPPYYSEERP